MKWAFSGYLTHGDTGRLSGNRCGLFGRFEATRALSINNLQQQQQQAAIRFVDFKSWRWSEETKTYGRRAENHVAIGLGERYYGVVATRLDGHNGRLVVRHSVDHQRRVRLERRLPRHARLILSRKNRLSEHLGELMIVDVRCSRRRTPTSIVVVWCFALAFAIVVAVVGSRRRRRRRHALLAARVNGGEVAVGHIETWSQAREWAKECVAFDEYAGHRVYISCWWKRSTTKNEIME